MEKVVLGLSGGVDSAVAGALLLRAGFEVHALFLDIGRSSELAAAEDAARSIAVPFERADIKKELENEVIAPFCEEYMAGSTPNPCVLCNPRVKFRALCDFADSIGARYVATGHYARVSREDDNVRLLRARSPKDQSYMLCGLLPSQLERLLLPLGEFSGKSDVRALAREMGLRAATKPDSMEICFVPDGDYAAFLEGRGDVPPEGNFVDVNGNILGRHRGIHRYTIGQRRGLGISLGERMFVLQLRPEANEVVLSPGDGLFVESFEVKNVNWLIPEPREPFECAVRVRHSKNETPALVTPREGGVTVRVASPLRAPTPGQAAAFYDGEVLMGGGVIA